nr:hypothetical protein [Bacteroidota bacterium]
MLKIRTLIGNWLFIGTLLISVLLIITVFSIMIPSDFDIFFNSDTLYLPSLYRDLFIDGNGFKGWNLSPSPNFFPDMFFYFILMFIFNDFIIASFIFSIVQYLIILILFATILKLIIPGHSQVYASISGILMLMFLFVSICSGDFMFTFFLLSNAFHAGAFVMAFLCLALTFSYLKTEKRNRLILIIIFSWLAILSDRLFIIMYLVPFILLSILYSIKGDRKRFLPLLITNSTALVIGIVLFTLMSQSGYIYLAKPHKMLDLSNSLDSFILLMNQIGNYLLQFNFKTAIILLSLLSLICICYFFLKDFFTYKENRNNTTTIYCLFTILFSVFVFGAPVLSGSYTGWDTLRYNIGFFYISILNLGFVLYLLKGKRYFRFISFTRLRSLAVGLATVALVAGVVRYSPNGIKYFFGYYPEIVKEIDGIYEQENLKLGVGSYWMAKYTTMFSKNGVVIHSVFDPIIPYHHITNENWFYSDSAVYNFIVLNRFTDPDAYIDFFGEGTLITYGGYSKMVKVRPFKFNRDTYHPYFSEAQQ